MQLRDYMIEGAQSGTLSPSTSLRAMALSTIERAVAMSRRMS